MVRRILVACSFFWEHFHKIASFFFKNDLDRYLNEFAVIPASVNGRND